MKAETGWFIKEIILGGLVVHVIVGWEKNEMLASIFSLFF